MHGKPSMSMPRRKHGAGRAWRKARILLALLMLAMIAIPIQAAFAGVGFGVVPNFASPVTVGQTDRPGTLTITNTSNEDEADDPIELSTIRLNPSCINFTTPCTEPDLGVFDLSATGTGISGACDGTVFTITGPDGNGDFTFAPDAPVVLGPTGSDTAVCEISFTFDVLRVPTVDVNPGTAGVQARQVGFALGASQVNGAEGAGTGASQTTVLQARPVLTTQVENAEVTEGGTATDVATLTGGFNPTGTVTFTLFGPDDATCTGDPVTGTPQVRPVVDGTAETEPVGPLNTPGAYSFVATYSGDANNAPFGPTACDDPDEQVIVLNDLPLIQVDKTVTPGSLPEPGGEFTFTVVVTNPSTTEPITITSLDDNVYGNLADPANPDVTENTCTSAIGTVLAVSPGPGNTYTCTFVGNFTGVSGDSETDIVTVVGVDDDGDTATDTDDAVVTITGGQPPEIEVVKTVTPGSLPEPGGDFTFTVVVTNTSTTEPITITSLNDNVYGNLADPTNPNVTENTCTSAIGTVLAVSPGPGNTYTCTFMGNFTGVNGDSETDTVTVVGTDDDGDTATDTDDAVVTITPTDVGGGTLDIMVDKTVAPERLPAPGGDFTFRVVVTNTGTGPLTITALTDDIYGNLADPNNPEITNNNCDDLIGDVLAPGASTSACTFVGEFTGNAGDSQTDVVTVTGRNDEGLTDTDSDDARVILDPPAGSRAIQVTKTASPSSLPEPGGDFTFSVVVTNTGNTDLTITTLTDSVYGNLATRGEPNSCDELIGDEIVPNQSVSCSFVGRFTGTAGQQETDVVTVVGRDDNNNTVTDTDDAVVTLTPLPRTVTQPPTALLVVAPPPPPGPGIIVTNNNSSNSSSSASAVTGSGNAPPASAESAPAPAPAPAPRPAPSQRLARTGSDSLVLFALGAFLLVLGSVIKRNSLEPELEGYQSGRDHQSRLGRGAWTRRLLRKKTGR